ncbi:unannotated protein [freshwater metagenome]|uniref:Unannotated protein n=1 Tax=freshwater metagenome TaxID=449393 RepID=A0A6J7D625_9ZZZZ
MSADIDSSETSATTLGDHTDRRAALKKLAVGGAIAWTAPTLLSGVAHAAGVGTPKCIPKIDQPGFGPGGGVLGTTTWTYVGGGTIKNYRWNVSSVVNYQVPPLSSGPGVEGPCHCSPTAPVVQFQWKWTAAYKSGKTGSPYELSSSQTTWQTVTPGAYYSKTFPTSGNAFVEGNANSGSFNMYSSVSLSVRVVCAGLGAVKAYRCVTYVSTSVTPVFNTLNQVVNVNYSSPTTTYDTVFSGAQACSANLP